MFSVALQASVVLPSIALYACFRLRCMRVFCCAACVFPVLLHACFLLLCMLVFCSVVCVFSVELYVCLLLRRAFVFTRVVRVPVSMRASVDVHAQNPQGCMGVVS